MKTWRRVCLPAAVAALAVMLGCASNAPDRHHTLRPLPQGGNAPAVTVQWVLRVGPVTVPEALDREAWVVRRGGTGMQVFEQQRWPQGLSSELAQSLADHLGHLGLPDGWVAIAGPATAPAALRLRLEVLRFDTYLAPAQGVPQASGSVPAPGIAQQMRWSLECGKSDAAGRAKQLHSALHTVASPAAPLPAVATDETQARFERLASAHALALRTLAEDIGVAARSSAAALSQVCAER